MNVYNAIMKAADHIEQNPAAFDFGKCQFPECGTPGCALGWIGVFLGMTNTAGSSLFDVTERLGLKGSGAGADAGDREFYARMRQVCTGSMDGGSWMCNANVCAAALRLYAQKYHSLEKPQRRPTSALVADLMALVTAERIPEGMLESPEYGQ